MAEAIASISEARSQIRRLRKRHSQPVLDSSDDVADVATSDASDVVPSPPATSSERDVVDDIVDSEHALRGRDRSLLRSGPYPITDPQNQNLVEK